MRKHKRLIDEKIFANSAEHEEVECVNYLDTNDCVLKTGTLQCQNY